MIVEVFYKFHLDKLSEVKNKEIIEKVIFDLLGQSVKVKFELSEKE